MSAPVRLLLLFGLLGAAIWVQRPDPPGATAVAAAPYAAPGPESRSRGLTFVAVAPQDERVVREALAAARPEARRLVDAVSGLVTIRVGPAGAGTAGTARAVPGGYEVVLELATVSRGLGRRGVERLVLHELGHVVDFALLDDPTREVLDAGIPRGYGCEDGLGGACAGTAERFAESFAKWAMDDIGVDLSIGYKVPPPALSLAEWAAPLTLLAR